MSENGSRPTVGRNVYTNGKGAFVPSEVRVVRGSELERDAELDADAVVVGSGAGGAVVAKELAEGGMSVVVLEEGERFATDDFTARSREMMARMYRGAGQVATFGAPPILLPLGKAVGGTSLINSGTCFRTPAALLDSWRTEYGLEGLGEQALDPFFRRVEREINVVQVPASIAGRNAEVVKRGADRLGYSGDYIFRNVRGCVGSGICNFGCPTSAKQHVGITYLPKSWEAGATTYSGCHAERVIVEGGRARGVEARAGERRLTVRAGIVIVAGGTIHSPLLLRRSGVGAESKQLGRNLSIHPATGMLALFDEEINMVKGVPQSYYIDEFADEGIMFEGAAVPPDYEAAALPYFGARHRKIVERYMNLSRFGVMVSDTARGWIASRAGRPVVRYDLDEVDVARFKKGLEILAEIYWAAGARTIYPPVHAVPELHEGDSQPLTRFPLRAKHLGLMAFHPLGTCRMGADPASSVVDGDLNMHGIAGLYVADGSVVPSPPGVNPQMTIMCLATRLAYHLLDKTAPVDEPEPETLAKPAVGLAYRSAAAA